MRLILARNTHQKNRKKQQFIFDEKWCQKFLKIFDKNKNIKYIKGNLTIYMKIAKK